MKAAFLRVPLCALILLTSDGTAPAAVRIKHEEKWQARRWVAAKFAGKKTTRTECGDLTLSLNGKLLKNMATTKVYHTNVGALPLKIAGQSGRGMVQAFRRPKSPATTMQFKLRGLDSAFRYRVTNLLDPQPVELTGKELMTGGLVIELARSREAALFVYEQIGQPD